MKKIIRLSLVLLAAIAIMGCTAYASLDCTVSIETTKTVFSENEEFVASIKLSNIQSERGVIAFGATLEYDKDSLTIVKMEGKNGWSTPSYNEENGKLVMDRSNVTNNDEIIFEITFRVKEDSKQNTNITLKDISVSDATTPIKEISSISKSIVIDDDDDEIIQLPTSSSNTNTNTNQNTNSVQNAGTTQSSNSISTNTSSSKSTTNTVANTDNSVTSGKLPKTGSNDSIKLLLIPAIISTVFFCTKLVKMRNV
jgi:hypothetical protein